VPVLKEEGSLDRSALCFHYPHYHHQGYKPAGAIHKGRYKLIEWFEASISGKGKAVELFDLEADPGEETDLSEAMPEMAAELLENLRDWRKRVGAQEMQLNANYLEEKADWRYEDEK
jgi:hypothetical protein